MGNRTSHEPKNGEAFRIVILGKTGSGKSSLGNNIVHKSVFKAEKSMNSVTAKCAYYKASLPDVNIEVVDTPGLCDTDRSEDEVIREISKCVSIASPGPHLMLWVISNYTTTAYNKTGHMKLIGSSMASIKVCMGICCYNTRSESCNLDKIGRRMKSFYSNKMFDQRFSNDEYHAFEQMIEMFSERIFQHTLVVFTGDDINKADKSIDTGKKTNAKLKEIMDKITNGYVAIDNCDEVTKHFRLTVLLQKCREIVVKNRGQHFSHDITEGVQRVLDGIYLKKQEENGRSTEEIRENVIEEILINEHTILSTILTFVSRKIMLKFKYICTIQ